MNLAGSVSPPPRTGARRAWPEEGVWQGHLGRSARETRPRVTGSGTVGGVRGFLRQRRQDPSALGLRHDPCARSLSSVPTSWQLRSRGLCSPPRGRSWRPPAKALPDGAPAPPMAGPARQALGACWAPGPVGQVASTRVCEISPSGLGPEHPVLVPVSHPSPEDSGHRPEAGCLRPRAPPGPSLHLLVLFRGAWPGLSAGPPWPSVPTRAVCVCRAPSASSPPRGTG